MAASNLSPKNARWEAVKEFLRVVLFAAIGSALAAGAAAANLVNDPILQVAIVTLVTSIGKAWDKYIK